MKTLIVSAAALAATAVMATIVCLTPHPTTRVLAGVPAPYSVCGNQTVEPPEECDPPGPLAERCSQLDTCYLGHSLLKYPNIWGSCTSECKCKYDTPTVVCAPGQCGAECATDADCKDPKKPHCNGLNDCRCVANVGGIADAPDADTSSLEATASGGSSAPPYLALAGAAAGIVVLGAGGWYARRRRRAG
jgi:LPXTG-motif cell wall-anchored protein